MCRGSLREPIAHESSCEGIASPEKSDESNNGEWGARLTQSDDVSPFRDEPRENTVFADEPATRQVKARQAALDNLKRGRLGSRDPAAIVPKRCHTQTKR